MSMLAEPRKRQRISVNPDGVAWSTDSSKFGQKLMETMGWQRGKGLGSNEDGNVSHVKVKMNMDGRGLGCSKKEADNWLAHQDDFNALLAQLSSGTPDVEASSAAGGGQRGFSDVTDCGTAAGLVEKSKSSRKRVHYAKFTKGKDLSLYDPKQLAQIFGRRATKTSSSHGGSTGAEPGADDSPLLTSMQPGKQTGASRSAEDANRTDGLIDSTLSVADYFARKMAAKRGQTSQVSDGSSNVTSTVLPPTLTTTAIDEAADDDDGGARAPKKKGKKSRRSETASVAAASPSPRRGLLTASEDACPGGIVNPGAGSDSDAVRASGAGTRRKKRRAAAGGDCRLATASDASKPPVGSSVTTATRGDCEAGADIKVRRGRDGLVALGKLPPLVGQAGSAAEELGDCCDAGGSDGSSSSSDELVSDELPNKLRKLVEQAKRSAAAAMLHFASSSDPDRHRSGKRPAPGDVVAKALPMARKGTASSGPAVVRTCRAPAVQAAPAGRPAGTGGRKNAGAVNPSFFVGSNILSLRGYTGFPSAALSEKLQLAGAMKA